MRTATRAAVIIALLVVAAGWVFWGSAVQAAGARAEGDNPAPVLSTLSPAAATAGGPSFTLTVDGSGFMPESQVQWDGVPRPTTYVSAEQLSAAIDASDIAAARTAAVTVFTPLPGGGVSAPLAFAVEAPNPVPDVTGLSPAQALVGDGGFVLTVIGTGFVPGSTVRWDGTDRATVYINQFMLTATVHAADVAAAGTALVSVYNLPPGGGQSVSARAFTIVNPSPRLTRIEPGFVWASGPAFVLTVLGHDFTPSSVVQWAGADRPTTYVSPERLDAPIGAADITYPAATSVRVFTPSPGGGLSAPLLAEVRHDDVAPITVISGYGGLWYRTAPTFTLVATDIGLGVLWTGYRLSAVAEFVTGTSVTVPAPKDHTYDGMHIVQYRSVDKAFNWEDPLRQIRVGIDTQPPTTAVIGATVVRNGTLAPRYLIADAVSPRAADALLVISNAAGKTLVRYDLGRPPTRIWRTGGACTVSLPRGTYRMRVLAHDLAGNAQSGTKSAALPVSCGGAGGGGAPARAGPVGPRGPAGPDGFGAPAAGRHVANR